MLLPAPSLELKPPPMVLLVPAFDCPASECMVPLLVATVGAADLLLDAGGLRSSPTPSSVAKLFRAFEVGVMESCPLALLAMDCRWRQPDSGYGLFLRLLYFLDLDGEFEVPFFEVGAALSEEVFLVSFFTHEANGCLRVWRSVVPLLEFATSSSTSAGEEACEFRRGTSGMQTTGDKSHSP